MNLRRVTDPAVEPISVEEFKLHARISGTDEDAYLPVLLQTAREQIEDICRRSLITQTWEASFDCFPLRVSWRQYGPLYLPLPMPPIQAVTSVVYVDEDGAEQTLAADQYLVDTRSEPGRIVPEYASGGWPVARIEPNAVRVTYTAGYGDAAADVPARLRQAVQTYAAFLYESREGLGAGMPFAVESLCWPLRVLSF